MPQLLQPQAVEIFVEGGGKSIELDAEENDEENHLCRRESGGPWFFVSSIATPLAWRVN
jgi:hypothetical protein